MNNTIELKESFIGSTIEYAIKEAKKQATSQNVTMWFIFNGRKVIVNANTNISHLLRDYNTSWIMDWKEIGPDCVEVYSKNTEEEISELRQILQAKSALKSAEYNHKEGIKRRKLFSEIEGLEIELKDVELWNKGKENNQDPYGGGVYVFAEQWAKLMQKGISDGHILSDIAEKTSRTADTVGLTGFMYGAAVSVLSSTWIHGEDLRVWHNKKYGISEDEKGVVNPAILTSK